MVKKIYALKWELLKMLVQPACAQMKINENES